MKVICVNHERFSYDEIPFGPEDPQIGDECNVIEECIGASDSGIESPCFELEGFSEWVYDQRNFATLPSSSADEMAEEVHEAIVNLETVLV